LIQALIGSLKGKDLNDLIAEGSKELAGTPTGGGNSSVAASGPVVEEGQACRNKERFRI